MKLSEVVGDIPHIKEVVVKLVGSDEAHKVGLRVLTANERKETFRRAMAAAKAAGVEKWDEMDPICSLMTYVETVAAAAVDLDSSPNEQWATAEELLSHHGIGQETLLYLYEMYEVHEQSHSIRPQTWERKDFLEICMKLAAGDANPLDRMRLGSLRTFTTFLADQYIRLLTEKWQSSSAEESEQKSSTDKKS